MENVNNVEEEQFIKVVVRVRPPDFQMDRIGSICTKVHDGKHVILSSKPEDKIFTFDHIADSDSSQTKPNFLTSKNSGQTGSGKTFTMFGPSVDSNVPESDKRGLIPRCLDYLFTLIKRKKELHGDAVEFLCKCSFAEIYQELTYDLLDSTSGTLQVRESIKRGIFLEGAAEVVVNSGAEAYQVLQKGWYSRTFAETTMNRESSRSHAVFMLFLESKETMNGVVNIRVSQLNLIDLAGSERQKDTNACNLRLKEAGSINKSLSVLGNVMMALVDISQGKNRHIPYRNSKLTFLLRDSLGGNARTCVIANVHPNSKCFGETLSTLQFAQRAKQVKNRAIINEDVIATDIESLRSEVKRLKELLQQTVQSPYCSVGNLNSSDSENVLMDAFRLIKKYEDEKEKLKKFVAAYKEAYERSEKNFLTSKMIVKLRESKIETLENAIRDSSNVADDQSSKIEKSLQEEIQLLKQQLDHHPQVIQLRLQIDKIKEENRVLRRAPEILLLEQFDERTTQKWRTLIDEAAKSANETGNSESFNLLPQFVTPARTKSQSDVKKDLNVALGENERLKSENAHLLNELSCKTKAVEEYAKIMRANCLQKELLNDIHVSTLKTLTPPRQSCSKRRQTMYFTPAPTNQAASLGDESVFHGSTPKTPRLALFKPDLLEGAANLMDEEEPLEFVRPEDLVEEIKKLRDMNVELEKKADKQQRQILKLEMEQNGLQQILVESQSRADNLKKEYDVRENELCSQIADLTHSLRVKSEEVEFSSSEAQDLKIILSSNDKKMQEMKTQCAVRINEINVEFSDLQSKVSQLQVHLCALEEERNSLLEEKENLLNRVEIVEAQLDFNNDLMQDYENKFLAEESLRKDYKMRLELLESSTRETTTKDLTAQLTAAENEKLSMYERQQTLEDEIKHLKQILASEITVSQSMKTDLQTRTVECETFASELTDAKMQFDSLNSRYDEITNEFKAMKNDLTEEIRKNEDLKTKLRDTSNDFTIKETNYQSEIETLSKKIVSCEQTINDAYKTIERLNFELEELQQSTNDKNGCSSSDVVGLEKIIADLREELQNLRQKSQQAIDSINELESIRVEKDKEIKRLNESVASLIEKSQKAVVFQTQLQQLTKERKSLQEKYEKLQSDYCNSVQLKNSETAACKKLNEEYNKIEIQLRNEQENSRRLTEECAKMKQEISRLKNWERQLHEEKENLKSELAEIKEVNVAYENELQDLKSKLDLEEDKNCRLVGHTNKKQKIHYVESLRNENKKLKDENAKLKEINVKLEIGDNGRGTITCRTSIEK